MPEGPVVLLSETAEIDTSWWRFDGAWARSNLGDGHSGDWSFAAYPGSLYPAGIVAALSLSQPLSLPPGTRVELKYWQRLDVAGGDSAQVQVSSDNANWVTVVSETAVRNFAWTVRTVQLDSYAGQLIWLRFVLSSDADPTTVGDGWWLDDITVWAEPLPVMSRLGLSSYDSDDLSLWLAEESWQAVGAPVHSGGLAWTAAPQPNTATALTLNADISLTGMNAPELRFWHQLNLASGEDRAQVELSTDGGQTWQPIVLYPGMTTASDWNEQIISLAAYTGQTVRIRFLLVLGSSGPHGASWAIDTIQVQSGAGQLPATFAVTDTPVPSPGTTAMTATLSPMPEVAGWATYADTDPMLQYGRGSWQTFHVAAAVGGTLTGTADREATLTVQFQGTGIRVIYSKGPEGQILVGQVDDGHSQADNTHSPHYSYGHSLTFDGLSADHHVLRVTNGWGAIWIEAIEVQGTLLPSNAGVSPVAAIPTAVAAPPLEPSGDIGINAVTSIEAAGTYEIIEGAGNGTFSLEVLDGGLTMHAVYAAPEGWWRSQSSRWDIATINGPVSTVILEVTGPAIPMNDWTDDCPAVGTWMPRFNPYDIWPSQVLPIEGGYRYVYYMNQTITGIGGYANTYRACPKQLPTPKTYDWTVRIIEVNGVPQITPTPTPSPTPTITPSPTSTPTPCQISFSTNYRVREKGNKSGYALGNIEYDETYTAYSKSPPSLDGAQVWVEIDFNGQRGWVQAEENGTNVVTPTSLTCYNELEVYQGNFPVGWEEVARIEASEVSQVGSVLAYLFTEGQNDQALLLARLAISESGSTTETNTRASYLSEVEAINWTVRIRAFIGLLNYNPAGTTRVLQLPAGSVAFISSGQSGETTSVYEDVIFSNLLRTTNINTPSEVNIYSSVYQPIAAIDAYLPNETTGNLAASFYPKDVFAVEDLYAAYLSAQAVLDASWNNYLSNLRGLDSWFGHSGNVHSSSRAMHSSGQEYLRPLKGVSPYAQNSFYDWYDPDNYFLFGCVAAGLGLQATDFPGGPFSLQESPPASGFYESAFPVPPMCN